MNHNDNRWNTGLDKVIPYDRYIIEAIKKRDMEALDEFIKDKLEFNGRDRMGRTPLHWAANLGFPEIVKKLLDHGANPDKGDKQGRTALYFARCHNTPVHLEIEEILKKYGASKYRVEKIREPPVEKKPEKVERKKIYTACKHSLRGTIVYDPKGFFEK